MILAIDTSGAQGSVALGTASGVVAEETFHGAMRHSATLFPALEKLDLPNRKLAAIFIGLGPGSFSGIRVALAAAQGLALPGNVPVFGVCSAWSVARQLPQVTRLGVFADARRGEYYCTVYANGLLERDTYLLPRERAEEEVSKMTLAVSADPLPGIPERCAPRAADYLILGLDAPELVRAEADGVLEPIYLREAV
jgi:tRNA threonylcarbamoyl adenosine modification protein YeaZ